jgi:clostripain
MLKKWLGCMGLLAILSSVAPAMEIAVNFDGTANGTKEFVPADAAVTIPPEPAQQPEASVGSKEWTVMVYVNAKNNLERFGLKDVNEMEAVGSNDKVNVVVELGRIAGYDSSDGNWTGSKRYLVKKDANPSKITSPVLQTIARADMGDYKHLVEFGTWAKTNFPAKHYMLVVWNHGSGWDKSRAYLSFRGISYDDESGNHITTPQLGKALKEIGKVDIYGSDACLMQMPEVTYELMPYADYIVGSEETEPGDGYTYDALLEPLAANPGMSAEEFGRVAVNAYSDHYQEINEGATQSLINTAQLPKFAALLNDWTAAVIAANEIDSVKRARDNTQSYAVAENKDLYHFIQRVVAGTKNSDVQQKGADLMSFISKDLVLLNRTVTDGYADSHGIAIYLPDWSFSSSYSELAWANNTQWDKFVKWILGVK